MVVVLNPKAGGGRALQKWAAVEPRIKEQYGQFRVIQLDAIEDMREAVSRMLRDGERQFITAGGDGTVNCLLNALINATSWSILPDITIGAIGLGSSNDFHKPYDTCAWIDGIPCRLNFDTARLRDIGVIEYQDTTGGLRNRYWLLNASVGLTADANDRFNDPDAVLCSLKRWTTQGAIIFAALRTLLTHLNQDMVIAVDHDTSYRYKVTNLGIVKSPHFSGHFCYDSLFEPDSGNLYMHLSENMSLYRAILTMSRLLRRRFLGSPGTRTWQCSEIKIHSDRPFALEFDGEVVKTQSAEFAVRSKALKVCSC